MGELLPIVYRSTYSKFD